MPVDETLIVFAILLASYLIAKALKYAIFAWIGIVIPLPSR
jgi:hypothetical protein